MIVELSDVVDGAWARLVKILFEEGILRKVESHVAVPLSPYVQERFDEGVKILAEATSDHRSDTIPAIFFSAPDGVDKYLTNGMPIEANIKKIADEHIGFCEEKQFWAKDLKTAVKEHGHDAVLTAFYDWSSSQTNFLGKKPISAFLKNASANIGMAVRKPQVTNTNLSLVEAEIAYVSDNDVFFGGDYKMRLAILIKDHGPKLVVDAFKTFFQDIEPRSIPFAAKNFLERAEVIITTMNRQKAEEKRQRDLLDASFKAAKDNVVAEPEEEEEFPL